MKRKGDCKRRRKEEEASASATTTSKRKMKDRKMKDPPATNSRQSLKDPPVGLRRAAASNNREILKELAELLQNPAQKEKVLKFLSEELSDGELEPPAAATTEASVPAAIDEADGLDGSDGSDVSDEPERADVATQTDRPTLASVPKLTSRRQKIRDEELIPLDDKAFRFKRDGSIREGQNIHDTRSGSATRAKNWAE